MDYQKEVKAFSSWMNIAGERELAVAIRYFCEEAPTEEQSKLTLFAGKVCETYYKKKVYFRGLIEFSNYCKNNCYYCGLRKNNQNVTRYRLTKAEILDCCRIGHDLGFRTFVLQSGEDRHFTDDRLCRIVAAIREQFPDCAVTLSIGERRRLSYKHLFSAGADRYLLRHETADEEHYGKLHPAVLSLQERKRCLYDLKEIGYQVGTGFMVQSPFQTFKTLTKDFLFLRELQPHMVGIGPFIPQKDTRFRNYDIPSPKRTLILLSLIRILLPKVLLPATTALNTIDPLGRETGLRAGANVLMPNLSPVEHRENYALYDNKICTGDEAAERFSYLSDRIAAAGFIPSFSRGDHPDFHKRLASNKIRTPDIAQKGDRKEKRNA